MAYITAATVWTVAGMALVALMLLGYALPRRTPRAPSCVT